LLGADVLEDVAELVEEQPVGDVADLVEAVEQVLFELVDAGAADGVVGVALAQLLPGLSGGTRLGVFAAEQPGEAGDGLGVALQERLGLGGTALLAGPGGDRVAEHGRLGARVAGVALLAVDLGSSRPSLSRPPARNAFAKSGRLEWKIFQFSGSVSWARLTRGGPSCSA
jgi:hypothetical protein